MPSYLPRKESITLSAIDIVHDVGFQGLTTREIAKRESISEAALYRHFKNREEIVAAVFAYYAKFDHSIVKTIENLEMAPMESVSFFIERLAEYYEGYPAVASVMHAFDTVQSDNVYRTTVEIYSFRKTSVERLLRTAQSEGILRREVDPDLLSSVIWSAFFSQVYEWRIGGYGYSLKAKSAAAIGMLLHLATNETE